MWKCFFGKGFFRKGFFGKGFLYEGEWEYMRVYTGVGLYNGGRRMDEKGERDERDDFLRYCCGERFCERGFVRKVL